MWKNPFKSKKPEIFKDDDKFADIYKIIAKAEIDFDTDDNKSFTATIDGKLWVHVFYSTWSDDVHINSNIRVITDPKSEGKPVYQVSVETNFSEDNQKRLNKLMDVKVDEWRLHNLDRVEAERKERITKTLES